MKHLRNKDSCDLSRSPYCLKQLRLLIVLLISIALGGQVAAQTTYQGTAPVQAPFTGFGVDGDGYYSLVTPIHGDWFSAPGDLTPGLRTVFNMATSDPYDLNFSNSYHWVDAYGGLDPTTFTSSTKIHHPYGENFTYGPGQIPDKNEIENATVLFTFGDPALGGIATDLWCIFGADRQVNNGDAYIDFEFLQNPVYMVADPNKPGFGYIGSDGNDGTRTAGDLLVTIQFENGGTNAIPVVHRWTEVPVGSDSWEWVLVDPSEYDSGELYLTSNTVETFAPWPPFGEPSYDVNQFAEGAINLSVLIPGIGGGDNCNFLTTVFVRTKTSQSTTAELKDFPGAPFQLDFGAVVTCSPDTTVAACATMAEIEAAYEEWYDGFSFSGGVPPVTDNLASLPLTFAALVASGADISICGGSYTFTYTVTDNCDNVSECQSTFTIEYLPFPAITPTTATVACVANIVMPTLPVVYDNCGNLLTPVAGTPPTPPLCEGDMVYTWTYTDCEGNFQVYTHTVTIEYEDFTMPADDGQTVSCVTAVTQPTPPLVTDYCGNTITPIGPTMGGTYVICEGTITYTWTYTDCEGNSHDWVYTYTVADETPPDLVCPTNISQWCPDVVLMGPPEYSDNCTAYEDILLEYSFDGGAYLVPTFPLYFNNLTPGIHTVEYRTTDECGNVATCTFTIDITYDCEEDVDYVLNNGNPVFCGMVNNTLTATINVPYASVSWSLAPGSDWVITGPINGTSVTFNAMEDGSATFILTIMDVNGCTVTCEYTIECAPAAENCTLTMGGWGQPGGSYCDGLSQHDRLVQILTPNGVTVGRPGHSYTSTSGEAGAVCVEDVLPSGGSAAALNKDYICYENNKNLTKNILLGQSLTLAINIGNSEGLAGLPLNTSFLIADNYEASCGTVPDAYTFSYMTLSVPQNVVNYLNAHYGGATVGSLMEFANDALGKVYIPSSGNPSFSNISDAATVINEAFDENCKWAIYNEFVSSAPIAQGATVQSTDPDVMMSVAPNPFKDQVEIKYNLKTDSRVSLEVYNLQGVKVYTIFEGEAKAGFEYTHKFAPLGNRGEQVFLVVLKSVYGATTKRIINTY